MLEKALSAEEFAGLMARLGPFERAPRLAVGVSGGPDSMALCLLAQDWARSRGGEVFAATVDHGLRPESAAEAARVGQWLAARNITHAVLKWQGQKPGANIQAAARAARYRLLDTFCGERGILHLALAHHREDQVETLLLRLGRGSGVDGLAAMSAVVETANLRLLRPLLETPRARLAATLVARGQDWIEDPGNRDTRQARARLRAALPSLGEEGLSLRRLAATAGRLGRARAALEQATAALLAEAVTVFPAGYALMRAEVLRAAPIELRLRVLARVLGCIGGGGFPPRLDSLERLAARLTQSESGRAGTLAGCRVVPGKAGILVCREAAAATGFLTLEAGATGLWDSRFRVTAGAVAARVGKLGQDGWAGVAAAAEQATRKLAMPFPVRLGLPALWDEAGVLAVPHLAYRRAGVDADSVPGRAFRFAPAQPLAVASFFVD